MTTALSFVDLQSQTTKLLLLCSPRDNNIDFRSCNFCHSVKSSHACYWLDAIDSKRRQAGCPPPHRSATVSRSARDQSQQASPGGRHWDECGRRSICGRCCGWSPRHSRAPGRSGICPRRHGLRWQGGSRDTAFERLRKRPWFKNLPCVRKRRGAALPAAVEDAAGWLRAANHFQMDLDFCFEVSLQNSNGGGQ